TTLFRFFSPLFPYTTLFRSFYPILFYFRFPEPYYSVSRAWLVALDAVSLIRSALPKQADWLKQSGAVTQLSAATLLLLSTLSNRSEEHTSESSHVSISYAVF